MTKTLMRNFLNFTARVQNSPKSVLRQLYNITKNDVRTTTGSNLRNILLLTDLSSVDDLLPNIVDQIGYKEISNNDLWRVSIIKEANDMKHGVLKAPDGWTFEKLDEIIEFACTQ